MCTFVGVCLYQLTFNLDMTVVCIDSFILWLLTSRNLDGKQILTTAGEC